MALLSLLNTKLDRCFNSYYRFLWLACVTLFVFLLYFATSHGRGGQTHRVHEQLLAKAIQNKPKHRPNWMKNRSVPKNSTNKNFPKWWPHRIMSEKDDMLLYGQDAQFSGAQALLESSEEKNKRDTIAYKDI